MSGDRAQAHTLEAFTAALLLIAGILFSLQATAVTPLSASTSNQHIQNQQRLVANDLLATAAENGTLREAVLHWNTSEAAFEGTANDPYYTNGGPPTQFGRLLNRTFRDERIAFNVYVYFRKDQSFVRQRMVFMGTPSDNAVSASRTVTVFNETRLTGSDQITLETAYLNNEFYAPDIHFGGELYNVMEVRLVVWRM
jgi:hypothetical protein